MLVYMISERLHFVEPKDLVEVAAILSCELDVFRLKVRRPSKANELGDFIPIQDRLRAIPNWGGSSNIQNSKEDTDNDSGLPCNGVWKDVRKRSREIELVRKLWRIVQQNHDTPKYKRDEDEMDQLVGWMSVISSIESQLLLQIKIEA